jgi:hypothetical protein
MSIKPSPAVDLRRTRSVILTSLGVVLACAGALAPGLAAQQGAPAAASAAAADEPPAPPSPLVAANPTFDSGDMVKGDVVEHTFTLRNTGAEPVTIAGIAQSCGCMTTSFEPATIPPAGQGIVRVTFDTRTVSGQGSALLKVYLEGREEPAATLEVKFNVSAKLLAHPGYARWIYVQQEKTGTIGQTMYAADGADFEIVSAEPPMPSIKVTWREAKPEERVAGHEGRQWRLEPTLDPAAPVGPITGTIAVRTTHPRQKTMWLPVSGFVRPVVHIEPQRGDLGTISLSEPRRVQYDVRNFATEPIAVTGVSTDVPGVKVTLEPVQAGRRYKVVVELDPAAMKEGPFAGQVRLTTDSAKAPVVSAELSGTLVRAATAASGPGAGSGTAGH